MLNEEALKPRPEVLFERDSRFPTETSDCAGTTSTGTQLVRRTVSSAMSEKHDALNNGTSGEALQHDFGILGPTDHLGTAPTTFVAKSGPSLFVR